jgi:hypothetical protein
VRRQSQIIGSRRFLDSPFQVCPGRKPALASDRELRILQWPRNIKNRAVIRITHPRMKLTQALRRLRVARSVGSDQDLPPDVSDRPGLRSAAGA